jgi:hypothetical protein
VTSPNSESVLHQSLGYASDRTLPLRRDAARRRHGLRRRHDIAIFAFALPDDDDDRERRQGAAVPRAAAASRLAGARRFRHVGDRTMGRCRAVGTAARATFSRRSSTSMSRTPRFRSSPSERARCARPRRRFRRGSSG